MCVREAWLALYSEVLVLVWVQARKQRSDGTWYVTGARPTSAAAMLSAMSCDLPDARRGRCR